MQIARKFPPSIFAVLARVLSLISAFAFIPITLEGAGVEEFGAFTLLASYGTLFALVEFGVGNSLISKLARLDTERRDEELTKAFSTAVCINVLQALIGTFLILCVLWILSNFSIKVFAHDPSVLHSILIIVFALPVTILGSLGAKVATGLSKPRVASLSLMCGAIAASTGVAAASQFKNPLTIMIGAQIFLPAIVGLLTLLYLAYKDKRLRVRPEADLWPASKTTFSTASTFGLLQIFSTLSFQLDSIVTGALLGPTAVTTIATTARLLWVPLNLVQQAALPLWAHFARAFAVQRPDNIRTDFFRYQRLALATTFPISIVIAVYGHDAILLWTRGTVSPPTLLILACSLALPVFVITQIQLMLLNGIMARRLLFVTGTLSMLINLVVSILMTKLVGVSGPIWGSLIAQSLAFAIPVQVWISKQWRKPAVHGGTN